MKYAGHGGRVWRTCMPRSFLSTLPGAILTRKTSSVWLQSAHTANFEALDTFLWTHHYCPTNQLKLGQSRATFPSQSAPDHVCNHNLSSFLKQQHRLMPLETRWFCSFKTLFRTGSGQVSHTRNQFTKKTEPIRKSWYRSPGQQRWFQSVCCSL